MTTRNNVDVGALEKALREAQADRSKAKRTQKVEGTWLWEAAGPQFRAEVNFEGGKLTMESDQPRNMGGGGARTGPLHYCFFGLAACYTSSFAAAAAQMGVSLRKLTARLEGDLNFSRVFGLSQEPVMEEVRIALEVESDAPPEKLKEVERLAYQKCPAVYALTQPVKLKTRLEHSPVTT